MESFVGSIGGFLKLLTFNDIVIIFMSFIIIILLLIIYYLVKDKKDETDLGKSFGKTSDSFNIFEATKEIEEASGPKTVNLTKYEEEQEENAIISYQELLDSGKKTNIGYNDEEEYQNFEVKIRKIDLSESQSKELKKEEIKVPMMNNDSENDFLVALKKLQKELDG